MVKIAFCTLLPLLCILLVDCKRPLFKSDEITLPKQDLSGIGLKLDGFYFELRPNNREVIEFVFFYSNSTILHGNASAGVTPEMLSEELKNKKYISDAYDSRLNWGRWNSNGDVIKMEYWTPRDGPFPVHMFEGNIVNDTTINFHIVFRSKNGKDRGEIDRTYHFQKFIPKPDSTNSFVD